VFAVAGDERATAAAKMLEGNRMAGRSDYNGGIVALACVLLAFAGRADAAPTLYRVDAGRTVAAYTVAYLGALRQRGQIAGARGTLVVDLEAHDGRVELTLDARSVRTGFALRDAFVRGGALLDASEHPSIAFVSTHLAFDADRLTRIDGRLTLRGVTRDVSLDVARFDCGLRGGLPPQDCAADARTTLRRSDFGSDGYVPLIDDEVTLAFAVVGRR